MFIPIEALKKNALQRWHNSRLEDLRSGERYSLESQVQREHEIDRLMHTLDESVRAQEDAPFPVKRRGTAIRRRIQKSVVQLLHSFGCVIDSDMEKSFSQVLNTFITCAYDFDPAIAEEAVYQASRNVMIMNTFQMHLGKKVSLTPSVFAYSMLYPYTDNYLDAPDVDAATKHDANEHMLLRLAGIAATPRNPREQLVDQLLTMIEDEFDRRAYPHVYESLLAIHTAQTRSVAQQADDLSSSQLLNISVEKGGTSVLADGYLVAGDLSRTDAEFFFQFGVLLQLIDDLQDLHEDYVNQHRTLACEAAAIGGLEDFANRLLSYTANVLGTVGQNQQKLRDLIERSCRLLIFEAVAAQWYHFGSRYLISLEKNSPVRFDHLRGMKKQLQSTFEHRSTRMWSGAERAGVLMDRGKLNIGGTDPGRKNSSLMLRNMSSRFHSVP